MPRVASASAARPPCGLPCRSASRRRPGCRPLPAAPATAPAPPDERPPIEPGVPCETQEKPNLASKPGPAPPQRTVDVTKPVYKARYELAKGHAVKWLRKQLRLEGLDKAFEVVEKDITADLVDSLAEARK